MRARVLAGLPVIALLAATGCSAATGGQAQPKSEPNADSSPSGTPEVTLPHSGAPKVNDPIDEATLTSAQRDPCSTLTVEQVQTLRLDSNGAPEDNQAGPSCRWTNTEAGSSVQVYFPTKIIFEGLSQIYEKSKREGRADFFYEMKRVQGLPVVASAVGDVRKLGGCQVQVGLTDRQVVYVQIALSRAKQGRLEPCAAAREVAGMALTTMKQNA